MGGFEWRDFDPFAPTPEHALLRETLVEFVRRGEKPPERWVVGTEHEKIGLYSDSLTPVPFEGERGIGALLERIAESDGWERELEGANVIALKKNGASITLEPGGQMELSGAPLKTIRETCAEFMEHVELTKRVSARPSTTFGLLTASIAA